MCEWSFIISSLLSVWTSSWTLRFWSKLTTAPSLKMHQESHQVLLPVHPTWQRAPIFRGSLQSFSLQPGNIRELKLEDWRLKLKLLRIQFLQVLVSGSWSSHVPNFYLNSGGSFRCQSDWVQYLDENFEEVVCGGNEELIWKIANLI